jgi:uncharacterized membrane protein YeaQ/YmgE (transglycosylase-associated protein family)
MGFGMEFGDAAEVTDKFAHAINKSLIEWDDLASSVKFALPFFISTGQSLDQLLGALAVLTNRALEAGIAGRGLRQALAEFTQHAEDNSAAFHKMGVEILDVDGNMRELTDIAAQFQNLMGDGVKDMDVMMALMDDLNIRGATAFVHLVQNADEFQAQVDDLANSAGSAAQMAEIQQQSLQNQIQLVKNALQAPFLMSEDMGANQEYVNSFAAALHGMVDQFESLIVVERNGTQELTKFGEFLRDFVIAAMQELGQVLDIVVGIVGKFVDDGASAAGMLHMLAAPLKIVLNLLKLLSPSMLQTIILYKLYNKLLPLGTINLIKDTAARINNIQTIQREILEKQFLKETNGDLAYSQFLANEEVEKQTDAIKNNIKYMLIQKAALFSMVYLTQKYAKDNAILAGIIGAVTGALIGYTIVLNAKEQIEAFGAYGVPLTIASTAILMGLFNAAMVHGMSSPSSNSDWTSDMSTDDYEGRAYGGQVYPKMQYGGNAASRPYMVGEKGPELFTPHTAGKITPNNELGSGVTINISGDVYDGDNFANKVGQALPRALRNIDDTGGM